MGEARVASADINTTKCIEIIHNYRAALINQVKYRSAGEIVIVTVSVADFFTSCSLSSIWTTPTWQAQQTRQKTNTRPHHPRKQFW